MFPLVICVKVPLAGSPVYVNLAEEKWVKSGTRKNKKLLNFGEVIMHKFVTHKKNNFTMIDNALIYDNKISAKSKAVLIYLLSKPQEWKTSIRDISNSFKDGYDSIKSSLVELENEYYLSFLLL